MKRPLIIADSHGVFFSPVFGELKDPWESDGISSVSITDNGQKTGDYYVLNSRSKFFVRVPSPKGDLIDVDTQIKISLSSYLHFYDGCLVSIDGNVHMAHFMCQNSPSFDFYSTEHPKFVPELRQLIPSWAVSKILSRGRSLLVAKLAAITHLFKNLPVHFIAPPLPIPSERHIHENAEIFNFSVQRLEHPDFRLKIFHLYCRYLKEVCRETGISYVPPNQHAKDGGGFLLEQYWNGATHAKTEYYSFLKAL
jgi:hypothetical protein